MAEEKKAISPQLTEEALKRIVDLQKGLEHKEGKVKRLKNELKEATSEVKIAEKRLRHAINHSNEPELTFELGKKSGEDTQGTGTKTTKKKD